MRFGLDAAVEKDEHGAPVFVNGYPVRTVRASFTSIGMEAIPIVTDFVDYPFWLPATLYDGNLAQMSLMMAGSASRPEWDVAKEFDPSLNLERYLSDAGFADIRKDDYSKVPSMFTISTAMGHRVMNHEGAEPLRNGFVQRTASGEMIRPR